MSLSTTCRKVLPWCMPKATTATNLAVVANSCESFSAAGDDNFLDTPASKIIGIPFFTSFQLKTQYSFIAASNEQELSAQGSERALLSNFPPGPTPIDPSGLFVCRGPGLAPFQVAMDLLCLDAVHFFPQALGASEHNVPHGPFYFTKRSHQMCENLPGSFRPAAIHAISAPGRLPLARRVGSRCDPDIFVGVRRTPNSCPES